jgi:hypothetical protein
MAMMESVMDTLGGFLGGNGRQLEALHLGQELQAA